MVGRKRGRRLAAKIGLSSIYQHLRMTVPSLKHRMYLIVLKQRVIYRLNQVWCADVTHIPMRRGLLHLVAIKAWVTPKVLS